MTRVKICGITNPADALFAAGKGADAVGVVCVPGSKRCVSHEQAKEIFECLPPFVLRVIVAAPGSVEQAMELVSLGADCLQLHGHESPQLVKALRAKTHARIIKRIGVGQASYEDPTPYLSCADALLLDTLGDCGAAGGLGKTHNWGLSRRIVGSSELPVILAGGLNPSNVSEAIRNVYPYAVDVSSGVEEMPGKKGKEKITNFIKKAKEEPVENGIRNTSR